jgi:hypothetical protein
MIEVLCLLVPTDKRVTEVNNKSKIDMVGHVKWMVGEKSTNHREANQHYIINARAVL